MSSEEDVLREWRVQDEKAWQRIAMPLSAVRELREVVLASILLDGDSKALSSLLLSIYSLEGRLLREAFKKYRERTLDILMLDQRQSWKEIREVIVSEGNYRLSSEFSSILTAVKKIVAEKFPKNSED